MIWACSDPEADPGIYLPSCPGTPDCAAGGGSWGDDGPGFPAELAAPVTKTQISIEKLNRNEGRHFYTREFVSVYSQNCMSRSKDSFLLPPAFFPLPGQL